MAALSLTSALTAPGIPALPSGAPVAAVPDAGAVPASFLDLAAPPLPGETTPAVLPVAVTPRQDRAVAGKVVPDAAATADDPLAWLAATLPAPVDGRADTAPGRPATLPSPIAASLPEPIDAAPLPASMPSDPAAKLAKRADLRAAPIARSLPASPAAAMPMLPTEKDGATPTAANDPLDRDQPVVAGGPERLDVTPDAAPGTLDRSRMIVSNGPERIDRDPVSPVDTLDRTQMVAAGGPERINLPPVVEPATLDRSQAMVAGGPERIASATIVPAATPAAAAPVSSAPTVSEAVAVLPREPTSDAPAIAAPPVATIPAATTPAVETGPATVAARPMAVPTPDVMPADATFVRRDERIAAGASVAPPLPTGARPDVSTPPAGAAIRTDQAIARPAQLPPARVVTPVADVRAPAATARPDATFALAAAVPVASTVTAGSVPSVPATVEAAAPPMDPAPRDAAPTLDLRTAPMAAPPVGAPRAAARVDTAGRTFAAAIHRAVSAEAPTTPCAVAAPVATIVASADAALPAPPLDLRDAQWPAKMIERIAAFHDMVAETRALKDDLSIRLVPDALGTVDVSLKRDGDQVQVQITAEHAQTRQLLAEAAPKLADLAEKSGVRLHQPGTDAAGGGATGQRPQQQSAQQHSHPPQPRARRAATDATIPTDADRVA